MHCTLRFAAAGLLFATVLVINGCSREPQAGQFEVQSLDVPAAAGSLGPHLAVGPDGKVVLSWVQAADDRQRLLYSTLANGAWSTAVAVSEGDNWFVNWADFPSVVPLSDSLWAAHWLVRQPAGGYAYDVLLSLSEDGGSTWSKAVKPHEDGTPTEHGFVTLFPRDSNVGLIWLDGRNMVHNMADNTVNESPGDGIDGMTLRAASISPDLAITNEMEVDGLVCDCCQTDVAVTDTGAIAIYRNRTGDETRDIYVSRLIGSEWQAGHPVADDGWTIAGCPVNGPVISADGNRVAVAWFTGADNQPRVRIARSQDAGESFAAPVDVVRNASFGRVGLALLPDDVLAVSWLCKVYGEKTGVCMRTVSPGNELGSRHVLSGDDDVSPFSVPQLVRSGNSLVAVWTANTNGNTVISSSRIPIAALN